LALDSDQIHRCMRVAGSALIRLGGVWRYRQ